MLKHIARRWQRSVHRRGLGGTLALVPHVVFHGALEVVSRLRPGRRRSRVAEAALDREWGVDTSGEVELADLQIESSNRFSGVKYAPTSPDYFAALMRLVEVDHSRFVFIDLGSGKGRVLMLASLQPFRRVIGVEFSRELCAVAKQNVARFKHPGQRCQDIEVVRADAGEYAFPPDPSIIYLYNPFDAVVVMRVLLNLEVSLKKHPRPLLVIYYNARHAGLFSRSPLLVRANAGGPPEFDEPWAIFRSTTS